MLSDADRQRLEVLRTRVESRPDAERVSLRACDVSLLVSRVLYLEECAEDADDRLRVVEDR